MVTRIAVMGATGYTALELLKLLRRHPEVEIVALTSRQESRPHISEVHSELRGALDLHLEPLDERALHLKVPQDDDGHDEGQPRVHAAQGVEDDRE